MMGYNYNYCYPPPPLPTEAPPPPPPPPPLTSPSKRPQSSPSNSNGFREQWPSKLQRFPDFSKPPPPLPAKHHSCNINYNTYIYNHNNPQPHASSSRPRYNNIPQYDNTSQPPWHHNRSDFQNTYKKPRLDSDSALEPKTKTGKKKKPLSQTAAKTTSTIEEAKRAVEVEKEYNNRSKKHSLIIKFPDPELNKEIVANFHKAIENVHFQQPSTARFCFVSLLPSADADAVIKELNQQKFGDGYLCAEYKKDREYDMVLNPEDIDPVALYVGNLIPDVVKEEVQRIYPECRRLDIGYAMKMKFTRYAYVAFKDANDCIMAFKRTHGTEFHSKSLIVRFWRKKGAIGMPGEAKTQNPKRTTSESTIDSVDEATSSNVVVVESATKVAESSECLDLNLSCVKDEPKSDDESNKEFKNSRFAPGSIEAAWARHRPIIKTEIKHEHEVKEETRKPFIKSEPIYTDDSYGNRLECAYQQSDHEDNSDYDDDLNALECETDFDSLYQSMVNRANVINSLKEIRP